MGNAPLLLFQMQTLRHGGRVLEPWQLQNRDDTDAVGLCIHLQSLESCSLFVSDSPGGSCVTPAPSTGLTLPSTPEPSPPLKEQHVCLGTPTL